ncbi:tetratricopeptide repeat protein [Actinokineospora sp. UTMC 2448]|uniref:tetratricopeptide repeat protein n=1 Tax=Actinokineospora sp. UTMC 2448 TaxID=2268449 RepID=UPI0021645A9F|nr:tetratricopeptide repeat protein [Actinokineospora sp. UTMC 2448]
MSDFCGRAAEVAALDTALADGAGAVLLDGVGGVGKTALAVWWAHRTQERFPGGTLFADLRGYGPDAPVPARVVLSRFLLSLGVREDTVPGDVDAQEALFRSLTATRPVLVVLDNAESTAQVRPVMPGSAGSFTVVTSRGVLSGLVVAGVARRIPMEVLDHGDAVRLVRGVVGVERSDGDPAGVRDLADVCGGLPLAVRVAATRLAQRPFLSVADVVEEILDEQTGTNEWWGRMRSVFDFSYRRLSPGSARVFRFLGLHPVPEFGVAAAAALTGLGARETARVLDGLADQRLVEPNGRGRYRMHDLLHDYAARRASLHETEAERGESLNLLLGWYAAVADAADRLVFPGTVQLRAGSVGGGTVPLDGRAQALAWFEAERLTLPAAQETAAKLGLHDVVMSLAATSRHLSLGPRGLWPDRLAAERRGLAAARACHDREAEMFLLVRRGHLHRMLDDLDAADQDFADVLRLAGETGNLERRREAENGLGSTMRERGRFAEAWTHYQTAAELARRSGNALAEAVAACNLSQTSSEMGRFEQALTYAHQELALRRRVDDPAGVAYALHDVAVARQGLGEHEVAAALCEEVIAAYHEHGGTEAERAEALQTLARSLTCAGQRSRASAHLLEAAGVLARLGDPRAETVARQAAALVPTVRS